MSSAYQMTRLGQLHRLKVKLENQLEQLRRDAESCSSHPQIWKRYDHVICNTERLLQDIDRLTAELLESDCPQGNA
jgi:cytochrome c556